MPDKVIGERVSTTRDLARPVIDILGIGIVESVVGGAGGHEVVSVGNTACPDDHFTAPIINCCPDSKIGGNLVCATFAAQT